MKIKDGLVMRRVGDSAVVISIGTKADDFHGMIKLNRTAEDIWNAVSDGLSEEEIAAALAEKYGISAEQAQKDTAALLANMKAQGFLCDE